MFRVSSTLVGDDSALHACKEAHMHFSGLHILPTTEGMSLFSERIIMARGRKTALTIRLTAAARHTLMAWQRSTTIPAGRARRGRIILLVADGAPISHIADTVGISRRFVYKWVRRFMQDGIAGLADKPGRGYRPLSHPHDVRSPNGTLV